jgi:hypothetical protein
VTSTPVVSANTVHNATASASCPAGTVMLSGGAQITTTDSLEKTQLVASYPASATTWTVVGAASVGGGKTWTLVAYALCA